MKKFLFFLIIFQIMLPATYAGCRSTLQEKVQQLNTLEGELDLQLEKLAELETSFLIIDAQCKDEIGNMAALYVERIQQLRNFIREKQKVIYRQRQIASKRASEQQKREQQEAEERLKKRIERKLVYIAGYGNMPNGETFNVVSAIKGQIKSQCPTTNYTLNSDDAYWSIQIAIDMNEDVKKKGEKYMTSVAPILVITNLISGEIVYEGTGLEGQKDEYIVYGISPLNEESAIKAAFRKACTNISPMIVKHLNQL